MHNSVWQRTKSKLDTRIASAFVTTHVTVTLYYTSTYEHMNAQCAYLAARGRMIRAGEKKRGRKRANRSTPGLKKETT